MRLHCPSSQIAAIARLLLLDRRRKNLRPVVRSLCPTGHRRQNIADPNVATLWNLYRVLTFLIFAARRRATLGRCVRVPFFPRRVEMRRVLLILAVVGIALLVLDNTAEAGRRHRAARSCCAPVCEPCCAPVACDPCGDSCATSCCGTSNGFASYRSGYRGRGYRGYRSVGYRSSRRFYTTSYSSGGSCCN